VIPALHPSRTSVVTTAKSCPPAEADHPTKAQVPLNVPGRVLLRSWVRALGKAGRAGVEDGVRDRSTPAVHMQRVREPRLVPVVVGSGHVGCEWRAGVLAERQSRR
jgi:hypothetical protein